MGQPQRYDHLPNPLSECDEMSEAPTEPCPTSETFDVRLPRLAELPQPWLDALAEIQEAERSEAREYYLQRTCGQELAAARRTGADLDIYRALCDALDVAVPSKAGDPLGALGELLRVAGGHCCAGPDAVTVRL